ncbi:MAG: P-loop NTPase [Deltaproteobacteria bacterium]|nr:P-loop NTPase [Deltaproteobacteria bacterium]
MRLLDARVVVVTGKGGVGKTATASAIALAAAQRGRRAAVVELYGAGSVPAMMGLSNRSYAAQRVAEGVDAVSLTPWECLDEYGLRTLKVAALARLFLSNRVVGAFLDAVPGLHDLVQLGKLLHMIDAPDQDEVHYDLVVLDAPATGHGLSFLDTSATMMEMTRMGPLYELASEIDTLLRDPDQTALALVSLPEELPARETLELVEALGPRRAQVAAVLLNQVEPPPTGEDVPWGLARAALVGAAPHLVAHGDQVMRRVIDQSEWRSLLARGLEGVPVIELPRLHRGPLGPAAIAEFAARIAASLEVS